jgi:hypothetical protein
MAVSADQSLEAGLKPSVHFVDLQRWFPSETACSAAFDPLLSPIQEFLGRPAKKIRAQLVFSSFELSNQGLDRDAGRQSTVAALAALVEELHAGSLVIDDIQDAGENRRGRPALSFGGAPRQGGLVLSCRRFRCLQRCGLPRQGPAPRRPQCRGGASAKARPL